MRFLADLQGISLAGGIHIREGNITLSDRDLHNLLMGIPPFPVLNSSTNNGSMSDEDIARVVKNQYMSKSVSYFDEMTQICLIVAFAVLILFGACGNGLVCYVVAKNPNMRTPRNIFIINLAISDLTLCCFTQPFNLMKVSLGSSVPVGSLFLSSEMMQYTAGHLYNINFTLLQANWEITDKSDYISCQGFGYLLQSFSWSKSNR